MRWIRRPNNVRNSSAFFNHFTRKKAIKLRSKQGIKATKVQRLGVSEYEKETLSRRVNSKRTRIWLWHLQFYACILSFSSSYIIFLHLIVLSSFFPLLIFLCCLLVYDVKTLSANNKRRDESLSLASFYIHAFTQFLFSMYGGSLHPI